MQLSHVTCTCVNPVSPRSEKNALRISLVLVREFGLTSDYVRASKKMRGCLYALFSLFFLVRNGLGLNIFNSKYKRMTFKKSPCVIVWHFFT